MSKPVLSNLLTFSGRRNRRSFLLFMLLYSIFIMIVTPLLSVPPGGSGETGNLLFFVLLITAPSVLAVAAQRSRDFDCPGLMVLIGCVPFFGGVIMPVIGGIFWLLLPFIPGTRGPNQYGPDPREPAGVGVVSGATETIARG